MMIGCPIVICCTINDKAELSNSFTMNDLNIKPSSLRNLGTRMDQYLAEVGIHTVEDLRQAGPVEAFLRVSQLSGHLKNRMALYAIYGALSDQDCICLPQETKDWLEDELRKAGYEG